MNVGDILNAIADALAPRLADRLEATKAPEWLSVRDCGLPQRTVRAAARRGELQVRRIGRADFVERAALASWVDAQQPAPQSPAPRGSVSDGFADLLADPDLEIGGER